VRSLRNFSLVLLTVVVALAVCWPSTSALWSFWNLNPYAGGHGPLVAVISAALILRSRRTLAVTPLQPSASGATCLIVCSLLWVIFWRAAIQELHMLLLPLILLLAVLAAFGTGVARACAFPLAFLYLAEPPWHVLIAPMQALTVRAVGVLAPLTGIPVRIAGNMLYLPQGVTFEVTPLCSGVNFLAVGIAVAALIGELQRASPGRRVTLLASMGLLAIFSNWLRVLAIVAAGYIGGAHSVLVSRWHVIFGWLLCVAMMFGFALAVRREARAEPLPMRVPPAGDAWLKGAVITTGILIGVPLLARLVPAVVPGKPASLALHLPAAPFGWEGPLAASGPLWRPQFMGAHSEWAAAYRDSQGRLVELRAIGYPLQEQNAKLVSEKNSLLGPQGLAVAAVGLAVPREPPHLEILAADTAGGRYLLWTQYDIDGRRFATPLFAQLWYGVNALAGTPYAVLWAYRTACEPTCDAARARLAAFDVSVGRELEIRRSGS